jgi:hypothetical protein
VRFTIKLNLHGVVSRLGSGEVESERNGCLLLVCLGMDDRHEKDEQTGNVKRAQHEPL